MTPLTDSEAVRQKVREGYGKIASRGGSCCGSTPGCCGSSAPASEDLAKHIGYSAEELAALPEGANMGLSCGNPNALAALQPGEVVLDLGAGGGFDVFIAGSKVGATGRAVGVDMTPEMLAKARQSIATYRERTGLNNVEFRLGEIEHLPLADASVEVVISNCVINLSPDKPQVWREIARVLKPGGRVAVSDLALLKPLPPAIAEMVEALVGCVAGAVLVSETERMAREAGLGDILLNAKAAYIDGMVDWQDPLYRKIIAQLPSGTKPSDYITSLEITAHKPDGTSSNQEGSRKHLEVYDPAMCCSTGVCGPEVDPKLVQFAADLKWLQEQGVQVARFNLSQNPAAFVENEQVKAALTEKGEAALPLMRVDGQTIASGQYPNRSQLAAAMGLASDATTQAGADKTGGDAKATDCCGQRETKNIGTTKMNTPNEDQKPTGEMELLKQQAAGCGPGCSCNATGTPGKTRWVIGAIVLAVAGVMVVRAAIKSDRTSAQTTTPAFASLAELPTPAGGSGSAAESGTAAPTAEKSLEPIGALSELNTLAAKLDAVFVYLPGKEVTSANPPLKPMQGAASAVESKGGLKCGLFTLKAGSTDYDQIAGKIPLPGVLAMGKGGGMNVISGDITEAKLVQGFVAASSAGGCGPSAGAGCCPK